MPAVDLLERLAQAAEREGADLALALGRDEAVEYCLRDDAETRPPTPPKVKQFQTQRIAPGERVALVGPTGAGKSTFVKLIQRLHDLQGGRIVIDGQDVDVPAYIRKAVRLPPSP